jgi:hypothetical protein
MSTDPSAASESENFEEREISGALATLLALNFEQLDASQILEAAADAFPELAPCRVEAVYRCIDGNLVPWPATRPQHPQWASCLSESGGDGPVEVPGRAWGQAFGLRHNGSVNGGLIVSAADTPTRSHLLLLELLTLQTATALSCVELHNRDKKWAAELRVTNEKLEAVVRRLERQFHIHEVLGTALATLGGEQAIADTLHELTEFPVAIEDRFGNLRIWSGPARPQHHSKPDRASRERLLHELAARAGPMRVRDRMVVLVKPRADVLGLLALIDPHRQATDDQLDALRYASTNLGHEMSHQRNLVEMESSLRRELVDDLVAGTDAEGAYARSAALGHDLRRPHYVVVLNNTELPTSTLATVVGRAATSLHLDHLQGRHAGLVVLLVAGRIDAGQLLDALARALGRSTTAAGVGSRCETPRDFPESFDRAGRALRVRLHSSSPAGAFAYDELGFYQLVDAARTAGATQHFARDWLGVLLNYDAKKNADLVQTLSHYLEHGGNYDEAAKSLHIHRSTLRYRLARIAELTGYDLRDVDTRFNLHAATRAWRFLGPDV